MSVLLCDNISKRKGKITVDNFSFNFLDKKIYGILGRSDSGKETLLDLITARTKPDTGTIWVDGEDLNAGKMKQRICRIGRDTFFSSLTIKAICRKMKRIYLKWDNYYAFVLCRHFDIKMSSLFSRLSPDRQQIFLAVCALASRANITVYENPLTGADIKDRDDFFSFLYKHHLRYPRTIIIASDYINEIDYLFHTVLFLDKGKLIDFFTARELKNNFRYLTGKTEVLRSLIGGIKIIGAEERDGILTVCIRKKPTKDEKRKFQKYLINISDVPLQKIFVYLINLRELRTKKYDVF